MVAKKELDYLGVFPKWTLGKNSQIILHFFEGSPKLIRLIFAGHGGKEGAAREKDPGALPQDGICTVGRAIALSLSCFIFILLYLYLYINYGGELYHKMASVQSVGPLR